LVFSLTGVGVKKGGGKGEAGLVPIELYLARGEGKKREAFSELSSSRGRERGEGGRCFLRCGLRKREGRKELPYL